MRRWAMVVLLLVLASVAYGYFMKFRAGTAAIEAAPMPRRKPAFNPLRLVGRLL